jgi:hypothetical protein
MTHMKGTDDGKTLQVAVSPKPLTEMTDAEIEAWAVTVWESMTGKKAQSPTE